MFLRHESDNKGKSIANKAEKNPITWVGSEPGPPGQKSNTLPLSYRVYSLTQFPEIRYKPISYAYGRVIGRDNVFQA